MQMQTHEFSKTIHTPSFELLTIWKVVPQLLWSNYLRESGKTTTQKSPPNTRIQTVDTPTQSSHQQLHIHLQPVTQPATGSETDKCNSWQSLAQSPLQSSWAGRKRNPAGWNWGHKVGCHLLSRWSSTITACFGRLVVLRGSITTPDVSVLDIILKSDGFCDLERRLISNPESW